MKSAVAAKVLGRGRVSPLVAQARLAICQGATLRQEGRPCVDYATVQSASAAAHTCRHCGCYMPTKVTYAKTRAHPAAPWVLNKCPRGYW